MTENNSALEHIMQVLEQEPQLAGQVKAALERKQALLELRQYSGYPVPKANEAYHADNFHFEVGRDHYIRDRKIRIGKGQMQEAWADRLQSIEGFLELAQDVPNKKLLILRNGISSFAVKMQDKNTLVVFDAVKPAFLTLKALAGQMRQADRDTGLRVLYHGVGQQINGVYVGKQTVVLAIVDNNSKG